MAKIVPQKMRRFMTSRLAISVSSYLASVFLKSLFGTTRIRFVVDDLQAVPQKRDMPGIYIFWHEMSLLPAYSHSHLFTSLVSESHDGELIARVLQRLGGNVIRGSTTHGRLRAFREICRLVDEHHMGIAADGPRGPTRRVPAGLIRAASVTGKPIVPIGIAFTRYFLVGPKSCPIAFPKLFSKVWMVSGRPVVVPPLSRPGRDEYRQKVQAAIDDVQSRAERLAAGHETADKSFSLKEVLAM